MKILAALLILGLASCASTTIYDGQGKCLIRIQGDIEAVDFKVDPDGTISFSARGMNHSNPTLAHGQAGSARSRGIGAAFAAGLGFLIGQK